MKVLQKVDDNAVIPNPKIEEINGKLVVIEREKS
jgi:hypothetical protein